MKNKPVGIYNYTGVVYIYTIEVRRYWT